MINGLLITSGSEKWLQTLKVNISDIARGTKNIFEDFSQHSKTLEMFPGKNSNRPEDAYTRRLDFPSPEIADRQG